MPSPTPECCGNCAIWWEIPDPDVDGWGICTCYGTQQRPTVIRGPLKARTVTLETRGDAWCPNWKPREKRK